MAFKLQNPFRDKIASKPEIRVLQASLDEKIETDDLQPNDFYFSIRLCELYLRKSSEAGSSYLPRALAVTECNYGDGIELTLPVAVGEHILAEVGNKLGDDGKPLAVSFHNCLLAGPMPYRGGDIGLFNGLYRVKTGDIADSVFNLVADITGNLGVDFGKYLDIGRQLTGRLPALLGVDTGNWRIGHYAPIFKEGDSFFDRYLVLVGEDGDSFDAASLVVDDADAQATLSIRKGDKKEPFNLRDYMLVKLSSAMKRSDYARFSFHERFKEAKFYYAGKEAEKAEWAMTELAQQIAKCPDLSDPHQGKLLTMYRIKIDQWRELQGIITKPDVGGHRGGADSDGDVLGTGKLASIAKQAGLPGATVKTLVNIASEWDGLHKLIEGQDVDDFSDDTVNAFMDGMADIGIAGGSAVDLADAFKIYSLSGH